MSGTVDVAIVGAGAYGLSVAAHLRGAGVEFRQFGMALGTWRSAMPEGMFLKSQGFASNLGRPRCVAHPGSVLPSHRSPLRG
jgi:cation diffusion facilitator CzcD-associated flavoprotein CzcO